VPTLDFNAMHEDEEGVDEDGNQQNTASIEAPQGKV
jgi:hypothetical protein